MSNCFHICNELLEHTVPFVVLNGYVPGCTSYDTNNDRHVTYLVQKITFVCVCLSLYDTDLYHNWHNLEHIRSARHVGPIVLTFLFVTYMETV